MWVTSESCGWGGLLVFKVEVLMEKRLDAFGSGGGSHTELLAAGSCWLVMGQRYSFLVRPGMLHSSGWFSWKHYPKIVSSSLHHNSTSYPIFLNKPFSASSVRSTSATCSQEIIHAADAGSQGVSYRYHRGLTILWLALLLLCLHPKSACKFWETRDCGIIKRTRLVGVQELFHGNPFENHHS